MHREEVMDHEAPSALNGCLGILVALVIFWVAVGVVVLMVA
jgi:hypothetical protein